VQNQGLGLGFAPIGHVVTVEGVQMQSIDVKLNLTYETGWNWAAVEPFVKEVIDEYFTDLASEWHKVGWIDDPAATLIVRISQLEVRLLSVAGIVDIADTMLDGDTQNIVLGIDSIPVRGVVSDG